MKPIIANEAPTVANVVQKTVNATASEATQKAFVSVVRLDHVTNMAEDITALLTAELKNASFMTVDLEITDEQREKLLEFVNRAVTTARDKYVGSVKKDERTKNAVQIVETCMRRVVDEALAGIGQEINRGAIISATAVAANAKKEDVNSMELNYSKIAGDITIPTRGVFMSTNCIAVIQDSCKVDLSEPATQSA